MSTQLIEVRNLTKVYGSGEVAVHALDGVNLSIPRGEFAARPATTISRRIRLHFWVSGKF